MPRYRFAFENKRRVDALQLTSNAGTFICIGCKERLQARVMGKVRVKHFAHLPGSHAGRSCNETYLHIITKQVFRCAFRKCVREGKPFLISYSSLYTCLFAGQQPCFLPCSSVSEHTLDLVALFDDAVVEKKDGEFIPDLLLTSSVSNLRCYIEILVSSPVSEAKKASGVPILEVRIQSEADVETISSCLLPQSMCAVYSVHLLESGVEYPCKREKYALDIAQEEKRIMLLAEEAQRREVAYLKTLADICANPVKHSHEQSQTLHVKGHAVTITPANIMFIGIVWIISLDQQYHSHYPTEAQAQAGVSQALADAGC